MKLLNDVRVDFEKRAIFRIGEIISVSGREVCIKVDFDKNTNHIFYCGQLIKNVSAGSYIKILKGFSVIIAKIESETLKENSQIDVKSHQLGENVYRVLIAKLIGYFQNNRYYKGIKEMPLIGNECTLLDTDDFLSIHRFAKDDEHTIHLGHLINDDNIPINISVNSLFASHLGIFGNTGSGKSHTLASLYTNLFAEMGNNMAFKKKSHFIFFDFNGEYSGDNTLTNNKEIYKISTTKSDGDRIPISLHELLKPELLSILASASEKTQQPFIKRAISLFSKIKGTNSPKSYIQSILHRQIKDTLKMADRVKSKLILDYLEQILPHSKDSDGNDISILKGLNWHGSSQCIFINHNNLDKYLNEEKNDNYIAETEVYKSVANYELPEDDFIEEIINILYIQLINDVISNRAQNEHIAPVINKLKSFSKEFSKVFKITDNDDIWNGYNIVVFDMNDCNLGVKKMIPMLISYHLYEEQKQLEKGASFLNIIIDEAHNILSYESLRESESFKDFRLETFEEIIKEGRKFGTFLTISSQRPSDISSTIVSQIHNYLIHRLVNNKDIEMIEKAVSYLDKLSIESLPILPVGACILSGIVTDLPVIIQVEELPQNLIPQSQTLKLDKLWNDDNDTIHN